MLHKAFKKFTPKMYKLLNINSVLIVPLISNDKAIGIIDISREKPFRNSDLERFKAISDVIITAIEKKIAEDRLKNTTLESNVILETGIDGMRVIDKDFNVLKINKQFCKISGLSKSKNLAKKCYESFSGEHCNKPTCPVKRLQKGLSYFERESEKVRTDGKVVPCLITVLPLMNADGKIIGVVENFKDITELKKAEEALLLKNYVFDTALSANSITDNKDIIKECNDAFLHIWGYQNKSEVIGKPISSFIQDKKEAITTITALNKSGKWEGYFTAIRKDGSTFYAQSLSTTIHDSNGKLIGYQSSIIDTTKKIKAEIMLNTEKETAQKYLDIAGVMIIILDKGGKVSLINKKGCEILGYSKDDIIGKDWFDNFLPEEIRPEIKKVSRKIFSGEIEPAEYHENPVLTRSGKERIISWHNTVLKDDDGKIIAILSSGNDITEKKKSREKLQHLNTILRTIRNVNQLIIEEKDKKKLIKSVCRSFTKDRGYHSAWIALIDDKGKLTEAAESGVGKDFKVLMERINKGKFTACWEKAMTSSGIIINKNPKKDCSDCPLTESYGNRGAMTVRLSHDKKTYGILSVSTPLEYIENKEDKDLFEEIAGDIAFALYSLGLEEKRIKSEEEIKNSYQKLQKTLKGTIDTLASIVEIRDPYTAGHQKRVASLAISISKELDLDKDKIEAIGTAAIIHDIGKINIPASILARPGKISSLEYDMIKTHPQLGYEMVKRIEFPWPIAKIILHHHERLDGSGYPEGLKGKDIVLAAKIIAVADTVEAMSSHRPYRPALGIDKALEEIKKGSGKLYDRKVVEACVKIITKKGFKF